MPVAFGFATLGSSRAHRETCIYATKNPQALSPVCFTPTGRPRVPAPPQKDAASAEGTQRESRDQLAPAEAYGGPALPHHRELRVPSGHMHVALGVRRVVARDHAAVVRGRLLSDRNRSCPSVLPAVSQISVDRNNALGCRAEICRRHRDALSPVNNHRLPAPSGPSPGAQVIDSSLDRMVLLVEIADGLLLKL